MTEPTPTPKPNKRNDQLVALFRSAYPGHADKAVAELKRAVRITKTVKLDSKTLVYVAEAGPLQTVIESPTLGGGFNRYVVPADSLRILS